MIPPVGTVEEIISNERVACVSAEALASREAMMFVPVPAAAVLVISVILRKLALVLVVEAVTSLAV